MTVKIRNALPSMWGAGYVPGMNAVIMGAVLAADKLGWEVVGIRDGFGRGAASKMATDSCPSAPK